jgi:hypothetical protein
MVAALQSL